MITNFTLIFDKLPAKTIMANVKKFQKTGIIHNKPHDVMKSPKV